MQLIQPSQNKALHSLLTLSGTAGMKADLVREASGGRTASSKELTSIEATHLIKHLENKLPSKQFSTAAWLKKKAEKETAEVKEAGNRMRRKIFSSCHQMGWYVPGMVKDGKPVLDYVRIDAYCTKYSPQHKALNKHTNAELTVLVSQFEKVLNAHSK